MHRKLDEALLALFALAADTRHDVRLLEAACVDLDPLLMPLLVKLGLDGAQGVVALAQELGRDHSSVSRQVDRLEAAGLVHRAPAPDDRRSRLAQLTPSGEAAVAALTRARRDLLDRALTSWSKADRKALARLLARFVESLPAAADADGEGRR